VEGGYLAVARLKKPHGLKGDAVIWALTDDPHEVLVAGRALTPIDDGGQPSGPALVIERSRPYHRQWLLKFEGIDDRSTLEGWQQRLFGLPRSALRPPGDQELYVHEVPGTDVVVADTVVGQATGLVDLPGGGRLLEVDVAGRTVLVPFRRPIVADIDRAARRITIDPPEGLLDV
jgi:16S rRNA processing protein RimM